MTLSKRNFRSGSKNLRLNFFQHSSELNIIATRKEMTNSYPKPNKLYNEIFTFQKVQIKFKVKKSEVVSRRQNSKKKKIRNIKQTNFIQTVKNNREKKK